MMKVLDEEEKQLHESIISLLDAISSYKETVDVGVFSLDLAIGWNSEIPFLCKIMCER